jgi:hypothetical protein
LVDGEITDYFSRNYSVVGACWQAMSDIDRAKITCKQAPTLIHQIFFLFLPEESSTG